MNQKKQSLDAALNLINAQAVRIEQLWNHNKKLLKHNEKLLEALRIGIEMAEEFEYAQYDVGGEVAKMKAALSSQSENKEPRP